MAMSIENARKLLNAANVFYDDDRPEFVQTLNMNDVWAWASADGEKVSDEELPEVANLFLDYGWCGILYWVSRKRGGKRSEFCDINRFIEFAEKEEEIKKALPNGSDRADTRQTYQIGRR